MNNCLLFKLLLFLLFSTIDGCPSTCVCSQVSTVECHGGSLKTIIKEVPSGTKQLTMTSVYVSDSLSFSNLPNLEVLSLTRSRIYTVAANAFSSMAKLRYLNLSHNGITNIDKEAFSGLYQLNHLDLSHNKLSKLDKLFYQMHLLKYLSLAWNDLTDLLTGLFRTQLKLQELILDGNRFKNLHSYSFQGLQNLLNLSLSNCWLSQMPQDFYGITRNLKSLDYSSNQIKEVLPSRILQNLPNLRLLSLYNNTITHLTDLQFSGVNLDTLNLSKNGIRKISDLTFKYFNTRVLDLSKNVVDTITSSSLRPTAPQLEYLSLAENPLSEIPQDAFQGLYRLLELNLSDCSLRILHINQFIGPNGLQKLDVSMNYLKNVPDNILKFFNSLESVNLEGNYWSCDCHIQPLRDWLLSSATAGKLSCSNQGQLGKCPSLECMAPLSLYQHAIVQLRNEQIIKCDIGDADRETSLTTILAIVASSIAFVVIICVCSVLLWKWANKSGNVKWLCNKSTEDSSHLDKPKKPRPFEDLDIGSLNESDRSFNVRNYFNSMVQNPGSLSRGTPSYSQKETPSHLGSQNSLYSMVSYAYGRESTV